MKKLLKLSLIALMLSTPALAASDGENELTKKNAQSLEKYLTEKLIQKNSSNFKNIYKGF